MTAVRGSGCGNGRRWALFVAAALAAGFAGWWLWSRDNNPANDADQERPADPTPRSVGAATSGRRLLPSTAQPATNPELSAPAGGSAVARPAGAAAAAPAAVSEDGAACDDGDLCTIFDRYAGGTCRGRPLECDDGNPLTVDSCTGDGCLHALVPGAFDAVDQAGR
jgi:hypothetical protein